MPWEYHPQKRSPWVWVSDADTAQSAATAQLAGPAPRRAANSPAAPETTRPSHHTGTRIAGWVHDPKKSPPYQYIECPYAPKIVGDRAFTKQIKHALLYASTCPNHHLLASIREIQQGDINGECGAYARGDVVVMERVMNFGVGAIIAALIHEAAHTASTEKYNSHAEERYAKRQENIALRHIGLPTIDPNDLSWHIERGSLPREES